MSSALALLTDVAEWSGLRLQALLHNISYLYQGHAFAGSVCSSQPLGFT